MSATEELRRLLDERGVEWMPTAWNPQRETFYRTANGVGICADEYTDGVRIHTDATITPEQAVDATLGRGTCHPEQQYLDTYSDLTVTVCSECGVPTDDLDDCNFCPNCGAKVLEYWVH